VAQTQHIKSARKTKDGNRPRCVTCTQPIEVGQGYYKNSPSRFSQTYTWHEGCAGPRASALESNEKRSQAYAAIEDAQEAVEAITGDFKVADDPTSNVEDTDYETRARLVMEQITDIGVALAEGINEAAELWRESASNIEDGFGHETERSAEMNEHADTYEEVANEAESITDQVSEWLEPDEGDMADEFDAWLEQAKQEAIEAIDNLYGTLD